MNPVVLELTQRSEAEAPGYLEENVFFKTFSFEIIMDSQEVANIEVLPILHTVFPNGYSYV